MNNLIGIENKRLVVVNECASTWEELKPTFDKFKTLITDYPQSIRRLYFDPYNIQNISNFIFGTNHKDSIVVEGLDRHYAPFALSEEHRNDEIYFAKIRAECFNQEVVNAFYSWLLDAKDFEIVPLNKPPNTELRAEFQQSHNQVLTVLLCKGLKDVLNSVFKQPHYMMNLCDGVREPEKNKLNKQYSARNYAASEDPMLNH